MTDKQAILALAEAMLKMSDEEFLRTLMKVASKKLAPLRGIESIQLRAQLLMYNNHYLVEQIRKEATL